MLPRPIRAFKSFYCQSTAISSNFILHSNNLLSIMDGILVLRYSVILKKARMKEYPSKKGSLVQRKQEPVKFCKQIGSEVSMLSEDTEIG